MEKYDPVVKKNVIFLHTWTTSEMFGHGKTSVKNTTTKPRNPDLRCHH